MQWFLLVAVHTCLVELRSGRFRWHPPSCVDLFCNDVLWEKFQFYLEILVTCHGSTQIEILDVDGHEFFVRCGYDAVEEELDCE
jgi:hypothetical protein